MISIHQVIYGTYRQDCLPNCVHNGQGNNGPAMKGADRRCIFNDVSLAFFLIEECYIGSLSLTQCVIIKK